MGVVGSATSAGSHVSMHEWNKSSPYTTLSVLRNSERPDQHHPMLFSSGHRVSWPSRPARQYFRTASALALKRSLFRCHSVRTAHVHDWHWCGCHNVMACHAARVFSMHLEKFDIVEPLVSAQIRMQQLWSSHVPRH